MPERSVVIQKTEVLSDHWYILRKVTFEYKKRSGVTETQSREVYDRGNGATVLLYNKEQRTVILVNQFRLPTFVNGNTTGMLIEACAGLLDNDNAEDCIRREVEEETGYQIKSIKKITEAYMSPGSVTELLHFFIAEYSASMKVSEGGGIEQEDIEVMELKFDQALTMVDLGIIKDGKTILLLYYLRLHHIL
ncbi:MAG: GDP-mannose pyrophosphatase NudK [Bacteroidetes bacterium]|nr:GDP-mannose pyrophosphatase NudK [Bacteroidota bacterium]